MTFEPIESLFPVTIRVARYVERTVDPNVRYKKEINNIINIF